jgi:hypothetical protein
VVTAGTAGAAGATGATGTALPELDVFFEGVFRMVVSCLRKKIKCLFVYRAGAMQITGNLLCE